jgi:RND family efflux transporter MFP subunit
VGRDELRRAEILADYTRLRAPFDGVITARNVDEGDFVQNSSSGQTRPLMTLAVVDRITIVLEVPERQSPFVRVGTEAVMHVDALKGQVIRAGVTRVSPALDPVSRTRRVEIDVENKEHKLLPGMYGQVTLTLQKIEDAYAVPATAVHSRGGENFILQVEEGVTRRHRVRIVYDDGKELVVVKQLAGKETPLDGSEELIVSNKGEIADGQRVRATPVANR